MSGCAGRAKAGRTKRRFGIRIIVAHGRLKLCFRHAREFLRTPIPSVPEALLALSFRLDLPIYRRYNPRT
jgi:hypothetical protein